MPVPVHFTLDHCIRGHLDLPSVERNRFRSYIRHLIAQLHLIAAISVQPEGGHGAKIGAPARVRPIPWKTRV
jgi:hypothetical protein